MFRNVIAISALIALLGISAFAGGQQEAADVPLDELETELEVWVVRDDHEIDLEQWEQMYPDIEINYEVVPWEEALDQLLLTSGTPQEPDVAVLDQAWVPTLASTGALLPLDDMLDEVIDDSDMDDFNDQIWDFVEYDGTTYAVPYTTFGRALFYRADWFEDAGLDPPETWDDVIEAGNEFHDPGNDRYGLTVRGARDDGTVQGWLPIFYAMGGTFEDDVPIIDSDAGIESLDLYRRLVWEEEIMSDETVAYGSAEARGLFISGNAAMSIIGTHIAPAVVNDGGLEYGEEFGMTHIPRPERGMEPVNVNTSFQFGILANTDYPEAALEFAAYASETDQQMLFNIDYMEAVRESVYEIEEYREAKPWADFILEDQQNMRPLPRLARYNEISEVIQDAIQEMLQDADADAASVAADAQEQIEEIMQ